MQGKNLARGEARFLLNQLLQGEATDAQIAAALVALSIKGETTEELAGMAEAMRPFSELCPAWHAADTARALCLAHFDENLKRAGPFF